MGAHRVTHLANFLVQSVKNEAPANRLSMSTFQILPSRHTNSVFMTSPVRHAPCQCFAVPPPPPTTSPLSLSLPPSFSFSRTRTHTHTHAHTHTHTHMYTNTRILTHACTHARTHARMHSRTHARTHTHVHRNHLQIPCGCSSKGYTLVLSS